MHAIHSLIVDLTLITIYAGITTLLCKKFKQPIVLGYVLAGIFAGPYFDLLPTVRDKEDLTLWADIGVIFLLFGLGLEFSFKKMLNVGKAAMITANANIIFMLFIGYNTGLMLGWSTMDSFFLGSMISMSSTTIIIKAFDDLNIKKQKFTDLVFGVLIVEDLVGILLLVLLPTIALGKTIDGIELGLSTLKLVFFLMFHYRNLSGSDVSGKNPKVLNRRNASPHHRKPLLRYGSAGNVLRLFLRTWSIHHGVYSRRNGTHRQNRKEPPAAQRFFWRSIFRFCRHDG